MADHAIAGALKALREHVDYIEIARKDTRVIVSKDYIDVFGIGNRSYVELGPDDLDIAVAKLLGLGKDREERGALDDTDKGVGPYV